LLTHAPSGGAPKKPPKAGDFIFGENSLEDGFPKKPLKPEILFVLKKSHRVETTDFSPILYLSKCTWCRQLASLYVTLQFGESLKSLVLCGIIL